MNSQLVVDPDIMDDETFQLHFTHRHKESLAGMSKLEKSGSAVVDAYRAFHRRLHELRPDLKHHHSSRVRWNYRPK